MKRVIFVILCLVLVATGFLIGFFTRPAPPAPPAPAPSGPPVPVAAAKDAPSKEPTFEISEEKLVDGRNPLLSLLGARHLWRYEHGPAWVHVEYFVDFEQDGVKKRAFYQAFNLGDDDSQRVGELPGLITEDFFDLAKSQGAIVLDKDRAVEKTIVKPDVMVPDKGFSLRTVRLYDASGHFAQGGGEVTAGRSQPSWDVFEWYQPASTSPPPALVLDYAQCEKAGNKDFYLPPIFLDIDGFVFDGWDRYITTSKGSYAGRDGVAVFALQILPMPNKDAANEEAAEAEVAGLRKEAAAKPDDAELKGKLARAIDHKRLVLKKRTPETEYPLAEEAVNLLREATKQEPGDMFLRAELRRFLLRWAAMMTEGKHAAEFPKTLEEIESLVPLYDDEYQEAAALLAEWKDPKLDKDLPENEKKRITQETDAHVATLLRRKAEIWQNRPDQIKEYLQAYEKDAKGKSYADTPEFKGLLEEMRSWAKKKD